jgi:TonB family protein
MFNNLIESSSHRKEFKRRGSFVLFTTVTYLMRFVITGVVSIYAFDARLEDQNLEVVTMLPPVDLAPSPPKPVTHESTPPRSDTAKPNYYERQVAMLSVNHPEVPPVGVSAKPNTNASLPESGIVTFGDRDIDPVGPGGTGRTGTGGGETTTQPRQIVTAIETPPPAPIEKPKPKVQYKGIITSQALVLPKPAYSQIAKQLRIQGTVSVQVLIDETGKVVSAKAVAGSPFLTAEAQKAALQARFSPTLLGDQPVKVSGVITYNFVLQ